MKNFKLLLSMLMFGVLVTSCTEKETVVNYGFVCSDNLFEFVEISATYTTNKGEETSVELTPSIMETLQDEEIAGETADGTTTSLHGILAWKQSKKYDDEVKANLTISFSKKEGIDYESYKGMIFKITKYAYLNSVYTEEHKGWSASSNQTSTIDFDPILTEPDEFYGDALEDYIDNLVANPIVK